MTDTYTRRRALAVGASGLAIGLAGCSDDQSGTDTESAASDTPTPTPSSTPPAAVGPIGPIPQGVTVLARADAQALLSGALFDRVSSASLPGFGTVSSTLSSVESAFGLDPQAVSELIGFQYPAATGPASGAVLTADWNTGDVSQSELEETTYAGKTLYARPSGLTLGVLGDGQFTVGQAATVQAVVDIAVGDADPATGDVVSALDSTPEGRAQFVAGGSVLSVPEGLATGNGGSDGGDSSLGGQTAEAILSDLSAVSGSLSADGDQRTLTVIFDATEDTAASLTAALNPALLRGVLPEDLTADPNVQTLLSALETADVRRDGGSVTVTYAASVEAFANTLEAAAALATSQ